MLLKQKNVRPIVSFHKVNVLNINVLQLNDPKMHFFQSRAWDKQTDERTDGSQRCLMPPPWGVGHKKLVRLTLQPRP